MKKKALQYTAAHPNNKFVFVVIIEGGEGICCCFSLIIIPKGKREDKNPTMNIPMRNDEGREEDTMELGNNFLFDFFLILINF